MTLKVEEIVDGTVQLSANLSDQTMKVVVMRAGLGLVSCFMILGLTLPAFGDSIGDFYKGRQISILIGYASGGGYDLNARLLSRYMGRHIPGDPAIVAKNMPGAGSLKAANFIYSVSPKDGTEFGTFARTLPIDPLLGGQGSQFDALKFNWLGSASNEVSTCVAWHTAKV